MFIDVSDEKNLEMLYSFVGKIRTSNWSKA